MNCVKTSHFRNTHAQGCKRAVEKRHFFPAESIRTSSPLPLLEISGRSVAMSLFASVLVLLLVGLYAADALPSGAPLGACANVAPDPTSAHGSTVQTDPPPYELDLSVFDANGTYQYNPGMTYTRTLPSMLRISVLP